MTNRGSMFESDIENLQIVSFGTGIPALQGMPVATPGKLFNEDAP